MATKKCKIYPQIKAVGPNFLDQNDINKKFAIDRKKLLMYHKGVDFYRDRKRSYNPPVPWKE